MKKNIICVIIMMMCLAGCNRAIVDTHYKFNYAEIHMPNGEIVSGKVESWRDYEDGDQIQVTIDGKTYLTHISNVILVTK